MEKKKGKRKQKEAIHRVISGFHPSKMYLPKKQSGHTCNAEFANNAARNSKIAVRKSRYGEW